MHGIDAIRSAALALGDRNPVAHHVTNIVITPLDDDTASARSKGSWCDQRREVRQRHLH